MKLYQNIECGNVFDYTKEGLLEVLKEADEFYDWSDSCFPLSEYYRVIEVDD